MEKMKLPELSEEHNDLFEMMVQNGKKTEHFQEGYQLMLEDPTEYQVILDYLQNNGYVSRSSEPGEPGEPGEPVDICGRTMSNALEILCPVEMKNPFKMAKKVSIATWKEFSASLLESNISDSDLFIRLFPNIMKRFATQEDFDSLFQHPKFVSEENKSPLQGFLVKKLLILIVEKFPQRSEQIFSKYGRKPFVPLPFVYKQITGDGFKIPIQCFRYLLNNKSPNIVSFGGSSIGKSKLLNLMFEKLRFTVSVPGWVDDVHDGIEVICSSSNFCSGWNMFDVQLDMSSHSTEDLLALFKVFPRTTFFLIHIKNDEDKKKVPREVSKYHSMLKSLGFDTPECCLFLFRDLSSMKDIDLRTKTVLKKLKLSQICVTIPMIAERSPAFKFQLSHLRNLLMRKMEKLDEEKYGSKFKTFEDNCIKVKNSLISEKIEVLVDISTSEFQHRIASLLNAEKISVEVSDRFFRALRIRKEIMQLKEEEKNIVKKNCTLKEKVSELTKIVNKIKEKNDSYIQLQPHPLVIEYEKCFTSCNSNLIKAFSSELEIWQEPIIAPFKEERLNLKKKVTSLVSEIEEFTEELEQYQGKKDTDNQNSRIG